MQDALTREEVARQLGITTGAVRLIELRAIAKLQKLARQKGYQIDDLITETIPARSSLIVDNEIHHQSG